MSVGRPAVSVVLPVYNTAVYLPRCLNSLLGQTFADFEILAVDDSSSDGCANILRAYARKDSRLRVFRTPHAGAAAARNLALKQARGRWLMFCDSDDWVEPRWMETLVRTVSLPGVDMAVCNCRIEEESDHGRSRAAVTHHLLSCGGRISFRAARWRINRVLWNKIFDLDAVRREEICFCEGREYDDDAFLFMYFSRPGTAQALKNKALYHYVLRGNSIMGRLFRHQYPGHETDQLYAKKFVLDWLLKRGAWERESEDFLAHLHFDLQLCYLAVNGEENRRHMAELAVSFFGGLNVPPGIRISPPVRAVLRRDAAGLLALLAGPDETVAVRRVLGLPVIRRVQSWSGEKVYILGMQVYKREAFFLGGQRRIFGVPVCADSGKV